jgi:hypothetical protein
MEAMMPRLKMPCHEIELDHFGADLNQDESGGASVKEMCTEQSEELSCSQMQSIKSLCRV